MYQIARSLFISTITTIAMVAVTVRHAHAASSGDQACESERYTLYRADKTEQSAERSVASVQRKLDGLQRRYDADASRVDREFESCQLKAVYKVEREKEKLNRLEVKRADLIASAQELVVEAGLCLADVLHHGCNRDSILRRANKLFASATKLELKINKQKEISAHRLEYEQQRCDARLDYRHTALGRSADRLEQGAQYLAEAEANLHDAQVARQQAEAALSMCLDSVQDS